MHQNLTFPVQPDPISGMHCWHQVVTVTRAEAGDRYGDVCVDTRKSHQVYQEWLAQTRPPIEPDRTPKRADRLRRPAVVRARGQAGGRGLRAAGFPGRGPRLPPRSTWSAGSFLRS